MAALTVLQRLRAWKTFLKEAWGNGPATLTKAQFEAAADAANVWVDANSATYLAALTANSPAFASATSGQQKALLLVYVLAAKYDLARFLTD